MSKQYLQPVELPPQVYDLVKQFQARLQFGNPRHMEIIASLDEFSHLLALLARQEENQDNLKLIGAAIKQAREKVAMKEKNLIWSLTCELHPETPGCPQVNPQPTN